MVERHRAGTRPGSTQTIEATYVVTPLDLERTYGMTEGNIFHGDLNIEQLFFMRPLPGWADYRSPIEGLYLCGAACIPVGVSPARRATALRTRVLRDPEEEGR